MGGPALRYGDESCEIQALWEILFQNFGADLIGLTCLLCMSVAGLFLRIGALRCILCGIVCVCCLLSIFLPHSERFTIQRNSIRTYRLGYASEIEMPRSCTLILSDAGLGVPFSIQSYRLKDRYAISILRDISQERILQILHANRAQNYTNATIERDFPAYFVYSCVYDRDILARLLEQGAARIIVPAKLADRFDLSMSKCEILADQGWGSAG